MNTSSKLIIITIAALLFAAPLRADGDTDCEADLQQCIEIANNPPFSGKWRDARISNCQHLYERCLRLRIGATGDQPVKSDQPDEQQQQNREPAQSQNAAMEQAAPQQATREALDESQATIQGIRQRQAAIGQALAARKRRASSGIGEKSTGNAESSRSIRRDDDTRITSDGRINAAIASDQLSASSGLPCTEYVANVVEMSGIDVNEKLPGKNYTIMDAINMNDKVLPGAAGDLDYLNNLVRSDPRQSGDEHPTKGVVYALTAANKGVEIDLSSGLSDLKRGDLVQYWYLEGNRRRGHAAVVIEPEGDDGKVTLRGSQKGVEGEFRTTLRWAHF